MREVLTLTVNPALDMSTHAERLIHDEKLRCAPARYDPGGGGVNVARAIHGLGGAARALYLSGGPTGAMLSSRLAEEGLSHRAIRIEGNTRENVMVHEDSTHRRFRFVMPGPLISAEEAKCALDLLDELMDDTEFVVASGSLAPGLPEDFYAQVARVVKARGARFVLDTSGPALAKALEEGVFLVKPNREELFALSGRELDNDGVRDFAKELVEQGRAQVVVASLGAAGAVVVSKQGQAHIPAAKVKVVSTVGAGDSYVGGLVYGLAQGWELSKACLYGAAAAGATLLTPGTQLCTADDAERLFATLSQAVGHK